MNYENFTIKLQEALQESSSIANKNDNAEISPEHLLQALLEQQDGLIVPVVDYFNICMPMLSVITSLHKETVHRRPGSCRSLLTFF